MQPKIELTPLFATPLYSTRIESFAERQHAFVEWILAQKPALPGIEKGNNNGWNSPTNLHLSKDEPIQWLASQIGDFATACIQSFRSRIDDVDIVMTDLWANVAVQGGWQAPHNYFPAQWSGIFYVSVEDASKTHDPNDKGGKAEFLNPIPLAQAYGQATGALFGARNGTMLLFPSAIQHLVHPNMTNNPRIVMSFNLNVVPKTQAPQLPV